MVTSVTRLLHCLLFRRSVPYTIYNFILTHRYQPLAAKLAMCFGLTFPADAFTYAPAAPQKMASQTG
jgi:hypothetical protein